ncbi:MAG: DNA starvation/stationary phase protection protein [Roseivirga sp.]
MYQLREKNIDQVVAHIQQLLANLHIHYQNIRNFHWNVSGPHFLTLHEHFEELYEFTAKTIDEVAERLLAMGVNPDGSLQAYIDAAEIQEQPRLTDPWAMVKAVKQGNEAILHNMDAIVVAADEAGDFGSSDMFTTYIGALEKQNWILSALLRGA